VIIAVIAAAMPGVDPVTTGLEMLPLVILFLASIVLLKFADRRTARRAAAELAEIETQFNEPPDNAL
jgi:sec-independent protein translocase protein TatC